MPHAVSRSGIFDPLDDFQIFLAGEPVLVEEAQQSMRRDITRFVGLSILAIANIPREIFFGGPELLHVCSSDHRVQARKGDPVIRLEFLIGRGRQHGGHVGAVGHLLHTRRQDQIAHS